MSSRTPTPGAHRAVSARTKFKVDKGAELPPAAAPQVDISSLELASDFEADCDPYNNTGQHCLEAMRRVEDRKKES